MLFTPIRIGQLTLPGRVIKTATSEARASEDYELGFPVVRGRFGRYLEHLVEGSMRHVSASRRWLLGSFRRIITLACNLVRSRREGFNLEHARAFKARLSIPVICVGSFLTRAAMEAALKQRWCDVVDVALVLSVSTGDMPRMIEGRRGFCHLNQPENGTSTVASLSDDVSPALPLVQRPLPAWYPVLTCLPS